MAASGSAGAVNWVIQSDGGVIASFASGTSQRAFTTLSLDLLSPTFATHIPITPASSTTSSASATSTPVTVPPSDPGLPLSTKIALGTAIPLVTVAIGVSLFFIICFRRRYKRESEAKVAYTMEMDSDELYEVEAREKPAELSEVWYSETTKHATMIYELDSGEEAVLEKAKLARRIRDGG